MTVMNIVIQRLIRSAALSLWTGLCSLHGEAEQLVPRGRDLWASVTHTDDKITPLRSAVSQLIPNYRTNLSIWCHHLHFNTGTISWIQTTRTTFIFYLKKSCNCQCKWQLDMQYWYAENSWGKTVFVDGINTMYGYNWHLGRWHCECIRKSQQYISINQNVPLSISLYQMKIWIQIWRPVDKIPFTPRPDSQTVNTNVIVTSKAGNLKSSYNIKGWLLTTG